MEITQQMLAGLNSFIEDTCVIFSVCYLLSRGKSFQAIFHPDSWSANLQLGLTLGLIGASEVVFPGMRSPYLTDTLAITLVAMFGGWLASISAIAVVALFAVVQREQMLAIETTSLLVVVALTAKLMGWATRGSKNPWLIGLLGGLCQLVGLAFIDGPFLKFSPGAPFLLNWTGVPANAFGLFLVAIIIRDAENRLAGQRHRLDLERIKTLQVAAELAALRSRIHPHFLFNALTAIATLCNIDPSQAEKAIVKLSRLMRRTISYEIAALTSLQDELDYVRAYADIQVLRFGERVSVSYSFDIDSEEARLPAFGLQTLVENAFQHGFEKGSKSGMISILGRKSKKGLIFAVSDSGVGMDRESRAHLLDRGELPKHGMGIIDKELQLLFGRSSRLRIFSAANVGTLVCFRVPVSSPVLEEAKV